MAALITMSVFGVLAVLTLVVLLTVARTARRSYAAAGPARPRTFDLYRQLTTGQWRRLTPPDAGRLERVARWTMDFSGYGGIGRSRRGTAETPAGAEARSIAQVNSTASFQHGGGGGEG